jgi:Tfp pilus assembly protein PilE
MFEFVVIAVVLAVVVAAIVASFRWFSKRKRRANAALQRGDHDTERLF